MRTAICVECGKAFETNAHRIKYCTECRRIVLRKRQKTANAKFRAAHKKPSKTYEIECAVCGKKFLTTRSWQRVCSKECSRIRIRKRSHDFYHSLENRLGPEVFEIWKLQRAERAKSWNSKPGVKARVRELARVRRHENDKDPEKRKIRLTKRRDQDYRAGRRHPRKPLLSEEQLQKNRHESTKRWYHLVFTKGKDDYNNGIISKEAIAYSKILERVATWAKANPDKVKAAKKRSYLKREMEDAYGRVNAMWLSMGVLE